jgi:acetylornithine/N-succinyldiaminopimelate aminotransferase
MSAILNTYNRKKVSFTKGKGAFLYGTNGKKYLDFVQGIAVNCLGHANNYLINSISKQSKKLWHVSNAFVIPEQERLAKKPLRVLDLRLMDLIILILVTIKV